MPAILHVIGAPSSAGAYAPGQEKAPAAFRRHGLMRALADAGSPAHDLGDVSAFRWRPDLARPKAMNLDAVARIAAEVAVKVEQALAVDGTALVLGGDCTIELGTVAGVLRQSGSVGLVYIDLDTDLNPPEASDGALDWTGVAHLLDIEGAAPELSAMASRRPMLAPGDILFVAADNISPGEAQTIQALGIEELRLSEVKRDPAAAAASAAKWGGRFEHLLVHVDVDVLAYTEFPIAENVRREPGLTIDELSTVLSCLLAAPNWRALTVTEVNPDHAPDEAEIFRRLIAVLAGALSRRRDRSPGIDSGPISRE